MGGALLSHLNWKNMCCAHTMRIQKVTKGKECNWHVITQKELNEKNVTIEWLVSSVQELQ